MYLLILSNSHSTNSLITCSHLRSTSLSSEVDVEENGEGGGGEDSISKVM